jgi:putative glycosyltransferase (TIGR04372 family)
MNVIDVLRKVRLTLYLMCETLFFLPALCIFIVAALTQNIRFCYLNTNRLGHFAVDLQITLAFRAGRRLIVPFQTCCNSKVRSLYEELGVKFVKSDYLFRGVARFRWLPFVEFCYLNSSPALVSLFSRRFRLSHSKLGLVSPVLRVADIRPEKCLLDALPTDLAMPIVVVSVRDGDAFPGTEEAHYFRSNSSYFLLDLIRGLLALGVFVVRIGGGRRCEVSHPNFLDYQFSKFKSESNDIYLLSRAYRYIGDSSGVGTFRQFVNPAPSLFVNFLPLGFLPKYPGSYVVYKKSNSTSFVSSGRLKDLFFEDARHKPNDFVYSEHSFDELLDVVRAFIFEPEVLAKFVDFEMTRTLAGCSWGFGLGCEGAVIRV